MTNLKPGDFITAKYRGKEWRRAEVVGVRPEGSFDIKYDNEEQENGVPPSMVRIRDSPRTMTSNSPVSAPNFDRYHV